MSGGIKVFTTVLSAIPVYGLTVLVMDICYLNDPFIGDEIEELMPIHFALQLISLILVLV